MLELFKSGTFWSAVSALATLGGAVAIVFAAKQLRFEAYLKAQELWMVDDFRVDRGKVLARFDKLDQTWTPEDEEVGLKVCRRMDEFVRLATYFGRRRMLGMWGDPLARAWVVLEPLVDKERRITDWETKWDAFEKNGRKALRARPHLQAKMQRAKQTSKSACS